jgi:hypothetical protein
MNFSDLTVDCIFVVFSHFSFTELVRYSVVCHDWYDIARTKFLWKDLCTQEFCKTISTNKLSIFHYHFYYSTFSSLTLLYIPDSDYQKYFVHKVSQDSRWRQGKCTTKIHTVHKHSVRGVSFSPKVPHLLASSGMSYSPLLLTSIHPTLHKHSHFTTPKPPSTPSFPPLPSHFKISTGYDSTAHIFNVQQFPTPLKSFTTIGNTEDLDHWHR